MTICKACNKEFTPDKYHPETKYCGPTCRNRINARKLRATNQDYLERQRIYARKYKKAQERNCTNCKDKFSINVNNAASCARQKYCDKEECKRARDNSKHKTYYYKNQNKQILKAKAHKANRRSIVKSKDNWLTAKGIIEVALRDKYTCQYCKKNVEDYFEIDHVTPIRLCADLPANNKDNLVASCFDCNRSKNGKTLEEWFKSNYCKSRYINRDSCKEVIEKNKKFIDGNLLAEVS